jgi:hypothetical protein
MHLSSSLYRASANCRSTIDDNPMTTDDAQPCYPWLHRSKPAAMVMRVYLRLLVVSLALLNLGLCALGQSNEGPNCEMRASPGPLATFGGPATAGRGQTELGLGLGIYGEGFDNPCEIDVSSASNWFVRWRRGIASDSDVGFDAEFASQADGTMVGSTKVAARLHPTKGMRLEGGVGTSDGGDGRSVSADLAAEIGTSRPPERTWNYYASLQVAASHGCFNPLCLPGQGEPGSRHPGAVIPLGTLGSTARVSSVGRFVMEAGLGEYFSHQQPSSGYYVHLAFGMQFTVGKTQSGHPGPISGESSAF